MTKRTRTSTSRRMELQTLASPVRAVGVPKETCTVQISRKPLLSFLQAIISEEAPRGAARTLPGSILRTPYGLFHGARSLEDVEGFLGPLLKTMVELRRALSRAPWGPPGNPRDNMHGAY